MRAALLESGEQCVGEAAPDAALARGGIDAEELEPARGLLHPELTAADLAEHEADDLTIHFGDLRRVRVAADEVRDAVFPDVGAVLAGDALVDAADRLDVELVHGADAHAGHSGRF